MRSRLSPHLGGFLFLLVAAGCDAADPLGSEGALAFRRTDSPSGTNVVVVSYNRIDVSWQDNSPNETGFEVHRAPGAAGTFALIATTTAGVTSYGDGGLNGATEYCYKVRALRTTGKNTTYSDFSNASCGTTLPVPVPAAPSQANAVPAYSTLIALSWQDNSTDENGFQVEFSLDAGTSWQSIGWNPPANATTINHYGRTPDQTVCYRVMAFNSFGNSLPSNMDCTAPPIAPVPLSANGVSGPAIDLSWPDLSAVEDGYEVRRAGPNGQWSTVAVLARDSRSYHDVGIVADTRYSYSVAATKDGGYSDFSAATAMSVSAPPPAPTVITAVPQNSSTIAVNWAAQTDNVESFRLERSIDAGATWVFVGTTPFNQSGWWDAVLSEQRTCYRVFAVNNAGESASGVACSAAPAVPTDLSATGVNGGIIDLSWTDNSSVEDGYEVWQVIYDCGYYYYCYTYYSLVEILSENATSFRHSGLDPNAFYTYVVVARKDGGYSDLSNEVGSYPGLIVL